MAHKSGGKHLPRGEFTGKAEPARPAKARPQEQAPGAGASRGDEEGRPGLADCQEPAGRGDETEAEVDPEQEPPMPGTLWKPLARPGGVTVSEYIF